jgi:hypothetical protein
MTSVSWSRGKRKGENPKVFHVKHFFKEYWLHCPRSLQIKWQWTTHEETCILELEKLAS